MAFLLGPEVVLAAAAAAVVVSLAFLLVVAVEVNLKWPSRSRIAGAVLEGLRLLKHRNGRNQEREKRERERRREREEKREMGLSRATTQNYYIIFKRGFYHFRPMKNQIEILNLD